MVTLVIKEGQKNTLTYTKAMLVKDGNFTFFIFVLNMLVKPDRTIHKMGEDHKTKKKL